MIEKYDYIILGAGIVGLTIAKKLITQHQGSRILIIEKEKQIGCHGSGRNSGVLHSGIYYPSDSLKAVVCAEGSKEMASYCEKNDLSINPIGKVIVPVKVEDDSLIDLLYERAQKNGARAEIINEKQLGEIEPEARTATGRALYSPDTAIVNPHEILSVLVKELLSKNVSLMFSTKCKAVNVDNSIIFTENNKFTYGALYNATGQYADKIAKLFGAAKSYTSLPFKGIYYRLSQESKIKFNGLIYPVPDLNVPFLGVHSVKTIDGGQYMGPTAIPAFSRENYKGLQGLQLDEFADISFHLFWQYVKNNQGFRRFAHDEALRFLKKNFTKAAQALVPAIKEEYLLPSSKVGIRAQLLNTKTSELEMDFLVERKMNTVHILNAVSPAFTSSLKFADLVVNEKI